MRARRGTVVGLVVVTAYAALLVVALLTTPASDGSARRALADPVERFVDAWERSRSATFVTTGTFERRSAVTGSVVTSQDVVAQRPPRRTHRQLGGVAGRVEDRLLVCPAPPAGADEDREPCRLGEPGGLDYEQWVARQLDALRSILGGPEPLYDVDATGSGCFELDLRRPHPRAPFGIGAAFCFDDATGAPTRREVRYEGGISESLVVTDIRTEVTEADLDP